MSSSSGASSAAVAQDVLDRVRDDLQHQRGLDRWREDGPLLQKRLEVLARFVAKIAEPNPKPAALPRTVNRLALFAPGDCLSVRIAGVPIEVVQAEDRRIKNVRIFRPHAVK